MNVTGGAHGLVEFLPQLHNTSIEVAQEPLIPLRIAWHGILRQRVLILKFVLSLSIKKGSAYRANDNAGRVHQALVHPFLAKQEN